MQRAPLSSKIVPILPLGHPRQSAVARDVFDQVMSEEPLFDVTLKKKKKKVVNFSEDPLGVDGGAPAPTHVCSERVARPGPWAECLDVE